MVLQVPVLPHLPHRCVRGIIEARWGPMLRTLESSQGSRADAFLLEERDDSTAEGHHDGGDGEL